MKIKFDKAKLAQWGKSEDPNNTSEKIIERRESTLRIFGEFMDADVIEYEDYGKQEAYIVTKGDKQLRISVMGNQFDGGWISVGLKG